MNIHPYLILKGECAAALKFYEQLFNGKVTFSMTYAESPAQEMVPESARDGIIHATLTIGDDIIMASDAPPDKYQRPAGVHLSIHVKDRAEGERIFNALSENGEIQMPFQETFWAPGFGMCVDRFGIPWMVQCE